MDRQSLEMEAEMYMERAARRGELHGADFEVGDLKDYLLIVFRLLTPEQVHAFRSDPGVVKRRIYHEENSGE